MIQQVEQRFAEREKINGTAPLPGLEPELKERSSQFSAAASPTRPQRNLNDYDIAKQQIEEKQQLLNSQYSLNPAS